MYKYSFLQVEPASVRCTSRLCVCRIYLRPSSSRSIPQKPSLTEGPAYTHLLKEQNHGAVGRWVPSFSVWGSYGASVAAHVMTSHCWVDVKIWSSCVSWLLVKSWTFGSTHDRFGISKAGMVGMDLFSFLTVNLSQSVLGHTCYLYSSW